MVALAPIDGVVLSAYGWLLVELLFYAVPSEASVYQLMASGGPESDGDRPADQIRGPTDQTRAQAGAGRSSAASSHSGGAHSGGDLLAGAQQRSVIAKVVLYFLPTALGVACFLVPLVAVFWRGVLTPLVPIGWLNQSWLVWAGAVAILGGRLLTFMSVLQIRKRHRRRDLQPSGLFAWSRNPGLLGMYAFYLGNCLVFPCVGLFAGFIPYVWNMHQRVLME